MTDPAPAAIGTCASTLAVSVYQPKLISRRPEIFGLVTVILSWDSGADSAVSITPIPNTDAIVHVAPGHSMLGQPDGNVRKVSRAPCGKLSHNVCRGFRMAISQLSEE